MSKPALKPRIIHGDVASVCDSLEPDSCHGCLTDPPYGLSFMGKEWDHGVPSSDVWRKVLRVLKPGAMLLAFGGTRTQHRLTCAIEDAGFEIRDCLMWLYGSGFPKSHDISKAIDRTAGAERDAATAPATPEAQRWNGYGTALKPAWEPIIVAMKPLDGTFAENALKHGVAGLNIDVSRIGSCEKLSRPYNDARNEVLGRFQRFENPIEPPGRWPANLLLDESAAELLDQQSGTLKSGDLKPYKQANRQFFEHTMVAFRDVERAGDSGGASRFFYCAKASKRERGEENTHPCVKPISLNEYLAKLILPPQETEGHLLVPFSGSGSEILGARAAGWSHITGIEREAEYISIAQSRMVG